MVGNQMCNLSVMNMLNSANHNIINLLRNKVIDTYAVFDEANYQHTTQTQLLSTSNSYV